MLKHRCRCVGRQFCTIDRSLVSLVNVHLATWIEIRKDILTELSVWRLTIYLSGESDHIVLENSYLYMGKVVRLYTMYIHEFTPEYTGCCTMSIVHLLTVHKRSILFGICTYCMVSTGLCNDPLQHLLPALVPAVVHVRDTVLKRNFNKFNSIYKKS